jgi:hypothetical protein
MSTDLSVSCITAYKADGRRPAGCVRLGWIGLDKKPFLVQNSRFCFREGVYAEQRRGVGG